MRHQLMDGDALVRDMRAALPALLAEIGTLVRTESPSADLAAVARCAGVVADLGTRRLGVAPDRIVLDGHTHLRWRLGQETGRGPDRVLLLGHHDTVWPVGTLATHPWTTTGGRLRGPGCFDMKAGVVMALHAAAAAARRGAAVTVLITGDEEIGSPSSRALIEQEAAGARAALVLEASADGGALKTARKGAGFYRVRITGRAAHAGLEPERGVNAAVELAHQLLAVHGLGDPDLGTTVTPTAVTAGTTTNTVPGAAGFAVDVRVRDEAEQHRVAAALAGLRPVLDGARLVVEGGGNRPPLTAAASAGLFRRATALADRLGLPPLSGAAVGGASDGNFTAGVGTPTLDGLGAVGGGAHADDEHVLIDALPGRTALVTALICDVLDDTGGGR
ncbi:M20 family metallopeptidase [Dactylosporangium sp. NPDC005555]|uniref:M20 family metallopeptidase n=1 Tax=Dactylosporangium sp. NPDC005555 TaxID=3154889 RepID=UPI0033A52A68